MLANIQTRLIQEWRQNSRFRLGAWVIFFILCWLVMDSMLTYRQELIQTNNLLLNKLAKVKRVVKQKDWPERSARIKALVDDEEKRLWQASSQGLAQASIQTWMTRQLAFAKIRGFRLKVDKAKTVTLERGTSLWRVTATIEGNFDVESLLRFISVLETNASLMMIDKLEIKQTSITHNNLVVSAYFKSQDES